MNSQCILYYFYFFINLLFWQKINCNYSDKYENAYQRKDRTMLITNQASKN